MYRYMDTFMFMYLERTMADHWRDMRVSRDQPCAKHSEAVTIFIKISSIKVPCLLRCPIYLRPEQQDAPRIRVPSCLYIGWVIVLWWQGGVSTSYLCQVQVLPQDDGAPVFWLKDMARNHFGCPWYPEKPQVLASWSIARLRKKTTISTGWNWSSEAATKIIFDLWRTHTKGGPGRPPEFISSDRNLEPNFGNLPYPEKVPVFARSDLCKIDKIMMVLRFAKLFTVIRI